jgi:trimethylamine--corrinoid protein Co-methyltransferase
MAGPITMAGVLAQSAAETLAGIVVHQIAAPGAPVLAGSSVLPMDMKSATIAYGGPEYMLGNLGGTDYYNAIGVPSWIGAGCSDSHCVDAQAAAEVGANLALAGLAGTAFIHNLGFLSSGRTGSLEMLVLCDELIGWAARFAQGIEVTEETIGVEVVKRAAKDNSYLTDDHTTERYLTESWYPPLSERSDAMFWKEDGSVTLQDKIKTRLAEILDAA